MSGESFKKVGSLLGTGSDIEIFCGFKPVKVEVYNSAGLAQAVKLNTMADAKAIKHVTNGTMTFADCITLTDNGFIIEDDADLNAAGEALHFMAWQSLNS